MKTHENLLMMADEIGKELKLGKFLRLVTEELVLNEKFSIWSGSSKPYQYHYGIGGLAQHTFETVTLCLANRNQFPQYDIDKAELFLSALYHDAGKTYDYVPTGGMPEKSFPNETTEWVSSAHKRSIHHISRSVIMWTQASEKYPIIYDKYHERVCHAILAHHGTREWGSPIAPLSRVAWLVHLCDNLSARMYDAETLDIVKHYK